MKQKILAAATALIFAIVSSGGAARAESAVSEKAQRFFDRGTAAIKAADKPQDFRDAADEFNKASAAAPSWPDPYYNAGVALEKAGDPAGAYKAFKSYLKAAPGAPDAKQVQKKVNELEYLSEKQEKQKADADKAFSASKLAGKWSFWANGFRNRAPVLSDSWVSSNESTRISGTGDHILISVRGNSNYSSEYDGTIQGNAISGTVIETAMHLPGEPPSCGSNTYKTSFEGKIVDPKTILLWRDYWRDEVSCNFQNTYIGFKLTR